MALVGSVLSIYLIHYIFQLLTIPQELLEDIFPGQLHFMVDSFAVPELSFTEIFLIFLFSNATVGVGLAYGTYQLRWWYPRYLGNRRERRINEALPRNIAFMYAVSRSGLKAPNIIQSLSENKHLYGAPAEDMEVAIRQMELYGLNLLEALRKISGDTPSERFSVFLGNLVGVLESGRNLPEFLRQQHEEYLEERESSQEQLLETLQALAEGYVALLVVGPLLLISTLVIVGVLGISETYFTLQLVVYLVLPVANIAAILYLRDLSNQSTISFMESEVAPHRGWIKDIPKSGTSSLDGEITHTIKFRLELTKRLTILKSLAYRPIKTLQTQPTIILYILVPITSLYIVIGVVAYFFGVLPLSFVDLLVTAVLFLSLGYTPAHYLHQRYKDQIEQIVPDLLDRLSGANESGRTITESINHVSKSDLGRLNPEIKRLQQDILWGTDVQTALHRMDNRVRTPAVTRMVTLLTNAMVVTSNISPVLRIAAADAKNARQLQKKRKQEMQVYVIIIYISFFVFLVILLTLSEMLIPSIPTVDIPAGTVPADDSGTLTTVLDSQPSEAQIQRYVSLVYHSAFIQAIGSGLVAGQMGENDLRSGIKHVGILLSVTYLLFIIFL
ncbi:type II secretion system F family protein [Natrialbaceae archaeon A-CW1-1]